MESDKLNVLIVDDDEGMRSIVSEWLKNAGHVVASAVDGDDCVAKLSTDIDLIFLDIMMPGPRPEEVIKKIKDSCPNAFVIYMTAVGLSTLTPMQQVKGWKLDFGPPVVDYLKKPLEEEEVMKSVQRIIRRKRRGDTF